MLNACLSWWHYVFGRHRSEPKLQINIQMDFAHVHVAPAIGEWTRSQDHPWLVGERDTQSFGDHIEARALDFLFHEYSQADLSFFFFLLRASIFSNEAGFSGQCFCWHLRDLAKLLPRLLVLAPLSGELREPYISVAHCWQLWLFVQILLILDKHLERLMRM